MKFFNELSDMDRNQYNQIVNSIQKIKTYINEKLDTILHKVNEIAQQISENYPQLQLIDFCDNMYKNENQIEFQVQFNQFIEKDANQLIITQQNQIWAKDQKFFQRLFFSQATEILDNLYSYIQSQIQCTEKTIGLEQNLNQNNFNRATETIWRHSQILKAKHGFKKHKFSFQSGVAESFVCIQNFKLEGFYMAQLFQGKNKQNIFINEQDKQVKMYFSVHPGINLSQNIYFIEFKLTHNQMQIQDECYKILLNKPINLFKGQYYTISLISNDIEAFKTFKFFNKQPPNQDFVKFCKTDLELVNKNGQIKNDSRQSPLSGMIISKY